MVDEMGDEVAMAARVAERTELTLNAIRWANNILLEVLNNHGSVLPSEVRVNLSEAVRALGRV